MAILTILTTLQLKFAKLIYFKISRKGKEINQIHIFLTAARAVI